ncbi:MAG: MBOAT family protein [Anaerolineaceae bacterium]|nr:MBOAT family protein [Anaerolineaceae bacterium]
MSFVSLPFFVITIVTILLYFLFPLGKRWVVLLTASAVFYYEAAGLAASFIILLTAAFVYYAAILIEKSDNESRKKKFIFSIAVIAVLCVLILTKIKNNVRILAGFLIPMGISYYSFSLIGYLADVYTKKQISERNFLKFLLYTTFFLKIMQGPISKFRIIGPKLIEGHRFDYQNLCMGTQLIIWGYFKKLVITERTMMFVYNLFADLNNYELGGFSLLFATILWGFGFYCDFSGYMDIVTGIAQIMGIQLEKNFDRPFFSRSFSEFWGRWHITLGVWFRDYIYIPLGGSRKGIIRKYFNLFVVFLVSGVWHGTGLDYLIWGVLCGAISVLSQVLDPLFVKIKKILKINPESADWRAFQIIRTFCAYLLILLIATATGIRNLKPYFRIIFKDFGFGRMDIHSFTRYGLNGTNFVILVIAVVILWFMEWKQAAGSIRVFVAGLNAPAKWTFYALGTLIVLFLGIYGAGYSTSGFAYAFY